ncbi:MAG: hypothetical protein KDD56_03180 [Bdellovibrionales bacterium]|nr:hypothetical protein [Bdellovibrionales bacterium]
MVSPDNSKPSNPDPTKKGLKFLADKLSAPFEQVEHVLWKNLSKPLTLRSQIEAGSTDSVLEILSSMEVHADLLAVEPYQDTEQLEDVLGYFKLQIETISLFPNKHAPIFQKCLNEIVKKLSRAADNPYTSDEIKDEISKVRKKLKDLAC